MLVTNRAKYLIARGYFRRQDLPTNHYVALCTGAIVPTVDMNTLAELTEIAAGNGYSTGGISLTPGSTDFDVNTESDVSDYGMVQIKDLVWSASGGSIPASGAVPKYAILLTDEATVANRQIIAAWDLGTVSSTGSGSSLTIANLEIRNVDP